MSNSPNFYNKFSNIYDLISAKSYYAKPRELAVELLDLNEGNRVLSVACGTGQNFEIFQKYLKGSGQIVGIDLSQGMLSKAKNKIEKNNWNNVNVIECNAENVSIATINSGIDNSQITQFDSAICELGLTAIPNWEGTIDNMLKLVKLGGKIVIMDWYMKTPNLRGKFINWVGNADISKPTWQYLHSKVSDFYINSKFKGGDVYVASGTVQ